MWSRRYETSKRGHGFGNTGDMQKILRATMMLQRRTADVQQALESRSMRLCRRCTGESEKTELPRMRSLASCQDDHISIDRWTLERQWRNAPWMGRCTATRLLSLPSCVALLLRSMGHRHVTRKKVSGPFSAFIYMLFHLKYNGDR
jgi:hypothetical protein